MWGPRTLNADDDDDDFELRTFEQIQKLATILHPYYILNMSKSCILFTVHS